MLFCALPLVTVASRLGFLLFRPYRVPHTIRTFIRSGMGYSSSRFGGQLYSLLFTPCRLVCAAFLISLFPTICEPELQGPCRCGRFGAWRSSNVRYWEAELLGSLVNRRYGGADAWLGQGGGTASVREPCNEERLGCQGAKWSRQVLALFSGVASKYLLFV